MKTGWAILLIALLPAAADARAKAKGLPLYGHFAYSSLCWGKENKTVYRSPACALCAVLRPARASRLLYEYGNGPLQGARIKNLNIVGDSFEAVAETSDGELTLSATLAPRKAVLKRQFDFQKDHPPPVCPECDEAHQELPDRRSRDLGLS